MLKRANIQWTAKTLYNQIKKGNVNFDLYVQRNLCWDQTRKSLLIHSMLTGYPIPAFYAAKNEINYSLLDGLQRSDAISSFISNKYELCGLENYPVEDEDGDIKNINGFTFKDLTEELQDRIKDYSLTVYYFENITDEEIEEMFFRLNNGKALSQIELTRVKANDITTIKELAEHQIFRNMLTEKARLNYTNEDIVIKSYLTLFEAMPSYETKYVRSKTEEMNITAEQQQILTTCFDRILAAYLAVKEEAPKIATKIKKKTHLLSLMPMARENSVKELTEFILTFFAWGSNKDRVSINDDYNNACMAGSSKAEAIQIRIQAMRDKWKVPSKQQEEEFDNLLDEIEEIIGTEVA